MVIRYLKQIAACLYSVTEIFFFNESEQVVKITLFSRGHLKNHDGEKLASLSLDLNRVDNDNYLTAKGDNREFRQQFPNLSG